MSASGQKPLSLDSQAGNEPVVAVGGPGMDLEVDSLDVFQRLL